MSHREQLNFREQQQSPELKSSELKSPDLLDKPVKQVRAAEAFASALGWWARTYPGAPIDMGALMRRSGLIRSTAYAYLREYRVNGFVDAKNVPVARHLQP